MTRAWPTVLALVACARPVAPAPARPPPPGVAIALYADHGGHSLAVIDDRRWVEVGAGPLILSEIDPSVALASLVIEPLTGPGALAVGTCTRDRAAPSASPPRALFDADDAPLDLALASSVRCDVVGHPGRYLVRVLYSSSQLAYHAEHEIAVAAPDRAHVATQLAITAPAWPARGGAPVVAALTVFDGLPGGDTAPVELARGPLPLDGTGGTLTLPARDVPARVRRVLAPSEDLAAPEQTTADWIAQRHAGNADEPDALVWVWLELPGTHLAPGLVHVRVGFPGEDAHEVVLAPENRVPTAETDAAFRLPLWADDELRAGLTRAFSGSRDGEVVEQLGATVLDLGVAPHEVWLEEKLRPGGKRSVTSASATAKPVLVDDTLRLRVVAAPGKVARAGLVIRYQF